MMNFPTSVTAFQVHSNFPTSARTFQLQTFQLKNFQLLVLSNCPFQLHVSQKITQKIKLMTRYSGFLSGFCFQKWRSVTHPKQIFRNFLGFCFRKWRSVTHPIFGFCFRDLPIWVKAIVITWETIFLSLYWSLLDLNFRKRKACNIAI